MPDFARRLDVFRAGLDRAGVGGAFLAQSADVEYLTGVPRARNVTDPDWDAEVLVEGCFIGLERGPLFLFTHSEWSIPAAATAARYETRHMPPDEDAAGWLRDAAGAVGAGTVLAVSDHLPFRQLEALRSALGETEFVPVSPIVMPQRACKDADEVAAIRAAGEISLLALDATLDGFSTRFSRRDFLLELELQLRRRGSERIAYAPDIHASGPTTTVRWSEDVVGDAEAIVEAPAAVTVDWGGVIAGYRADVGRTFYVGEPPPGQRIALDAVRHAQELAIEQLHTGASAASADGAARAVMEAAGYGDAFWIPTGHGLGLDVHEPPRLRAGSLERIADHAVVTVEIAAWRDGELSAFWEDDVLVTEAGAERLTAGPDEPRVL
jgi:Xaa-Pro aminopeptidase